jgi:hypothetical protein
MHRLRAIFAVVALLFGGSSALGQEPFAENPSRDAAGEQMEIWRALRQADFAKRALSAAHFLVGDQHRAELVLISTLPEAVQIELEAYSVEGERFPLGSHAVDPGAPLRLDIGELIAASPAAAPVRGSLRLTFIGDEKALAAWLVQYQGTERAVSLGGYRGGSLPTRH